MRDEPEAGMNDNDGGSVNDSKDAAPSGDASKPNIHGNIVELDIQRELKDSYLTYAMSTIDRKSVV